jgi:RND superfamily putative drug exporter
MHRLGSGIVRFRWVVLVGAVVFMGVAGVVGGGVARSLSNGGFNDPTAESTVAGNVLSDEFGVRDPAVILIVTAPGGSVDDPAVVEAGLALTGRLAAEDGVVAASSYWSLGSPPPLRSAGGDRALVFASLAGDQGTVVTRAGEIADEYRGPQGSLEVTVGGLGPMFAEVQSTIEADLRRAEAIAFPITALLLIVVFGTAVAASLPLAIGGFAIVGGFLILQILSGYTEVSIFALNLTTAMGLGLAIDYSLFIVSRFREELAAGRDPGAAVVATVETAGRTILFSAGTVAVSLAAMIIFKLAFLRSFGYAGIAVVAMAAIGAIVVLPALLAVIGPRIERLRVRRVRVGVSESGAWHRIATFVMRRPVPIATGALVVLVVLGLPFFNVELGRSDDRMLPPSASAREAGDILRGEFSAFESSPLDVIALGVTDVTEVDSLAVTLSHLDGVARVDAATGSYIAGFRVVAPGPVHAGLSAAAGTYYRVVPSVEPTSPRAEALVGEIRGLPGIPDVLVTGATAALVDTKASLLGDLPWALVIIAVVTFVVLFLMFGSVVVPMKALVLNVLSLSATFGALVWIFQEGHLSSLLGFTATGALEITMPILMFCIAFGLSMDYEVFLLSRIKEEHDGGAGNVDSVARGLERTGRIVTAAAVLISVVFVAFSTSGVSFMKMFGVGMTLAVLVDAFVVRATLVPAFMRLAGEANWWAPKALKRIYERFGLSESGGHG